MQRTLFRDPRSLLIAPAMMLAACGTTSTFERADDASAPVVRQHGSGDAAAFASPPTDSPAADDGQLPTRDAPDRHRATPPRVIDEQANAASMPAPAAGAPRSKARAEARTYEPQSTGGDDVASKTTLKEREVRPGLGTTWGETRTSRISHVNFERHAFMNPTEIFRIFYNDPTGVLAQTGESSDAVFENNYAAGKNGFVSIEVIDPNGMPLPGLSRGGQTYVAGTDGERYTIRVRNHAQHRYEVVATVDGLDVIDGAKGNFAKRGYILDGYDTLLIEGFRQSTSTIAAFRFGAVADSYAARTQTDRNVGVIGVAVFAERGAIPSYTDREIQKRESADPFPGQFARPPQPPRPHHPRPRQPYLVE